MNFKFKTTKPEPLDEILDDALAQLKEIKVSDPNYPAIMGHVHDLYKLKEQNAPKRVSPDTIAMVVGNLAGVALIVFHEQAHVVSTKALGFVLKTK